MESFNTNSARISFQFSSAKWEHSMNLIFERKKHSEKRNSLFHLNSFTWQEGGANNVCVNSSECTLRVEHEILSSSSFPLASPFSLSFFAKLNNIEIQKVEETKEIDFVFAFFWRNCLSYLSMCAPLHLRTPKDTRRKEDESTFEWRKKPGQSFPPFIVGRRTRQLTWA